MAGPTTRQIIKECNCQGALSKCRRRKRFVTYFEGSSFEHTIDVGGCSGSCSGYGKGKQSVTTT